MLGDLVYDLCDRVGNLDVDKGHIHGQLLDTPLIGPWVQVDLFLIVRHDPTVEKGVAPGKFVGDVGNTLVG